MNLKLKIVKTHYIYYYIELSNPLEVSRVDVTGYFDFQWCLNMVEQKLIQFAV